MIPFTSSGEWISSPLTTSLSVQITDTLTKY